jgi:uncharacterized protein (DUF488 family)
VEIFSVGHSTHDAEAFVSLIAAHGVRRVVDVRTVPRSRRVPHFNVETLPAILRRHGIEHRHAPDLGGLRKPVPDSPNAGWEHAGFRGYADYMRTDEFEHALDVLMHEEGPLAYMCAEGLWWRCHRRLISDALTVRGWTVTHILPNGKTDRHRLTEFAVVEGTRITYPPPQTALDV